MMAKVELSHVLLLAGVCYLMASPASALSHIVGASLGWTIPPNKTYFQDWAKPRVFGTEDKLLFPFRSLHNVVEVGKDDFENCTQSKIINIYPKGPVLLNFTQPGDHFYYSGVGTQCEAGLKLHITVVPGQGSRGRRQLSSHVGQASSSRRRLSSIDSVAPAPGLSSHGNVAPAPAPTTSAAGTPIGHCGMVTSLISLVAWLFL